MNRNYKFSNTDINNILYSAIRNKSHLNIRKKTSVLVVGKILFTFFKNLSKKNKKYSNSLNSSILNFLPKQYVDLKNLKSEGVSIDLMKHQNKYISSLEGLLNLAFLINYKPFQKLIFQASHRLFQKLVNKEKLDYLICGHPTVVATFIGFCLKKIGNEKKVITLQHGIYNLNDYKVLWFEKEVATHVIVYGAYFKELYKSQGVWENNIIIGNPYFKSEVDVNEKGDVPMQLTKKKVLFLGQQFYKVFPGIFEPYNQAISNLIDFLHLKDIEIYYKPHPREDIQNSLGENNISKLKFFEERNDSNSFLNGFDIYYSVNSTLLLETYLQKKMCFQLDIQFDIKLDKFFNYSGIPLIDSKNLNNHLDHEIYEFYYDSKYLNISDSPHYSTLKIISNIIDAKENEVL